MHNISLAIWIWVWHWIAGHWGLPEDAWRLYLLERENQLVVAFLILGQTRFSTFSFVQLIVPLLDRKCVSNIKYPMVILLRPHGCVCIHFQWKNIGSIFSGGIAIFGLSWSHKFIHFGQTFTKWDRIHDRQTGFFNDVTLYLTYTQHSN
jgi:hypothetical protein